eukprot:3074488-Ditylum_brightwellii.AAC.1
MVRFVDDAKGQVNSFSDNMVSPTYLIELMSQDAQLWSDLLWLSGGYLELDKCFYHFIYYCFLDDGTLIMQSKSPRPPLRVQQALSTDATIIEYKNPFTPLKTLGHYKAPAWGHLKQKEILGDTLESYAKKAQTSALTNTESRRL